jgi:3-dehydroquinate dehydratase II
VDLAQAAAIRFIMAIPVFVLNGPNLNMLGTRERGIYGAKSLADIENDCLEAGKKLGLSVDFRQTNQEGILVDWIQEAGSSAKGIIINPGAYTHTSVALQDAIRAVGLPLIEVHISNIFARESFRHHSYVSPVAAGIICGLGPDGYLMALEAIKPLATAQ